MSGADIRKFLELVPAVKQAPEGSLWASYDREADVVYVNFRRPNRATDGELTDEDIILRYDEGELIGLTILHASRR